MDIKWIVKLFLMVLVLWLKSLFYAQQAEPKDTLDRWISKFYETEAMAMSPGGRWVAMKKRYTDQDSIFVFDTKKKKTERPIAARASMIQFYRENYAMLNSAGSVLWCNLETGGMLVYPEVKQSGTWSDDGFCMVDRKGRMQIMNKMGKLLAEVSNVVYYVTDGKGKLFVQRKTQSGHEVLTFQGQSFRRLVALDDFERMELTGSGKYLIVYRRLRKEGFRTLGVMDTQNGNWLYPLGEEGVRADFFTVREIDEGTSFLIERLNYMPYPDKEVEIWYGNDRDLASRERGRKPYRTYWLWKGAGKADSLHTHENETVSTIGSSRYLLVFRGDELQDYVRHIPDLILYRYDAVTGIKTQIGAVRPRLVASPDGQRLLLMNQNGIWQLLDMETLKKKEIERAGLGKPYFSQDSGTVYFESGSGLWMYSVEAGKMKKLNGERKHVQIIGAQERPLCTGYNFYQNFVRDKEGIMLKTEDRGNGTVSYYQLTGQKAILRYASSNHLKTVLFSADHAKMAVLEENFNTPPGLWLIEARKKEKKLLFDSGSSDQKAKQLRQQMISYTSSSGLPLKGILYYPLHYDPSVEYPVIVHIYQQQSDQAKTYLLPRYDEIGFNIRTVLERGYFVYLPDVMTENRSPGYSGIDGVEQALNALGQYPLKLKSFGLIGHSFGSYLVNFIATHSTRFATYISGSGVSDLISSYFSYNRNYSTPHYWQLETGQYEMDASFFQDKELYLKNSPILNADKVNAPVLLWTGLKDHNVVPDQTIEFYLALKRSGKEVVALLYTDGGHDLGIGTADAKDLTRRMVDWWDYFLKEKSNITWIDRQMKKDAD